VRNGTKVAKDRYAATPRGKFILQRKAAKQRGIDWLMTFEEWLAVWGDMLPQRGRTGLVMGRKGDAGPYSVENVDIITATENLRQRKMLCGDLHPRSKLSSEDVARVRDLLHCECTHQSIAEYIGVARTTVGAISRGENWSSI
jgi:hypothetical protein